MQSAADHAEGSALSRCLFFLSPARNNIQIETVCCAAHLQDVWSVLCCDEMNLWA